MRSDARCEDFSKQLGVNIRLLALGGPVSNNFDTSVLVLEAANSWIPHVKSTDTRRLVAEL